MINELLYHRSACIHSIEAVTNLAASLRTTVDFDTMVGQIAMVMQKFNHTSNVTYARRFPPLRRSKRGVEEAVVALCVEPQEVSHTPYSVI